MNNRIRTTFGVALLAMPLAACSNDATITTAPAAAPALEVVSAPSRLHGAAISGVAASCADIRTAAPVAADGNYIIAPQGAGFEVHCADMATAPKSYLTLARTAEGQNYSQSFRGVNYRTRFTRVRLNPASVRVDVGDTRFASTNFGAVAQRLSYGHATDCSNYFTRNGSANIDLTGTAFKVLGNIHLSGFAAAGTVNGLYKSGYGSPAGTWFVDAQVVNTTGGGYCGGVSPITNMDLGFNSNGGEALQLAFVGTPLDISAPVVTPAIAGTLGANGWYTSDATVSWNASAPSGIIASTGCATTVVTDDIASRTFTCSAVNRAGVTTTQSITLKRDATTPMIAFADNAGSYTVDQSVSITCSATDALSGIATSSCPGASGAAHSFNLGTNTLSASARDNAGNTNTASTTFTVRVTTASLSALVERWTSNAGVANSLVTKLEKGNIKPFINEVEAQSGKKIDAGNAAILIRLAGAL